MEVQDVRDWLRDCLGSLEVVLVVNGESYAIDSLRVSDEDDCIEIVSNAGY